MRPPSDPFRVHIRRQNHADPVVVLRFEVKEGMGILGLRQLGRDAPPPSVHHEEQEIDPGALRAGRFVHVLPSGQRQSYALSRLTEDIAGRLPYDAWANLSPVSEFGFRYLVVDEEALIQAPGRATVSASQPPSSAQVNPSAAPSLRAPGLTATRPTSVARVGGASEAKSVGRASLPPRQVPIAPALAEAALRGLDPGDAAGLLKDEMKKVEALHDRLAQVETQLGASQARERDLLEVLSKWQSRG
jgi:hypothetical protein